MTDDATARVSYALAVRASTGCGAAHPADPAQLCGAEPARLYLAGRRCDLHKPTTKEET